MRRIKKRPILRSKLSPQHVIYKDNMEDFLGFTITQLSKILDMKHGEIVKMLNRLKIPVYTDGYCDYTVKYETAIKILTLHIPPEYLNRRSTYIIKTLKGGL